MMCADVLPSSIFHQSESAGRSLKKREERSPVRELNHALSVECAVSHERCVLFVREQLVTD